VSTRVVLSGSAGSSEELTLFVVVVDLPVRRTSDEFEETKVVFTVRIITRRELAERGDFHESIGFDTIR
jgi:hypothetical protein